MSEDFTLNMWNHMTPGSMVDIQRRAAVEYAGEQARQLLRDGYSAEADKILDDLNVRRDAWDLCSPKPSN